MKIPMTWFVCLVSIWFAACQGSRSDLLESSARHQVASILSAAAASCSENDVRGALVSAAVGATVVVPAGNCVWSTLVLDKAVTLQGAGRGLTNITVNASGAFIVNKQSVGITRVQGFSFYSNNNNLLPPVQMQYSFRLFNIWIASSEWYRI